MGKVIQYLPFFTIMFMALFGGLFFSFGVPRYFSLITELTVYIYLLISIISRNGRGFPFPTIIVIPTSFLFISLLSIMLNGTPIINAILSLKALFTSLFFFVAIVLLEPDFKTLKKMNNFVFYLLISQLPVVALKFLKYGISERTMGAYAVHDGSIATTLPISFIFYLAAFYYLYQAKIRYIVLVIAFIFFSIVANKRAVLFLYPIQFLAIYYFIIIKKSGINLSKKFFYLVFMVLIVLVVSGSVLYFNTTLKSEDNVDSSIDLEYAIEYANRYNRGIDGYGNTFGRIATTERAIEILTTSGMANLLLGVGPGTTTLFSIGSKKDRDWLENKFLDFKIGYGMTSMVKVALEYGLSGVLFFSYMLYSLLRICWELFKHENDPYWKAFAAGSFGFSSSMIFFAFCYHASAFWGSTMPILYFYAMAVVYIRLKLQKRNMIGLENTDIKYQQGFM